MALFRKPSPPPLDRARSLDAIPIFNCGVALRWSTDQTPQTVTLQVTLARGTGWLARFQPAVMERDFKLDELGSFVVWQIDGKRSAREIVDAFVRHFQVNRREGELSCMAFLRMLATRRLISIVVP